MDKSLRDYITEAERHISGPAEGDEFDIEIAPGDIVSTYVLESTEDSITVYGDEQMFALLEEIKRYGAVGSNRGMGYTLEEDDVEEAMIGKRRPRADRYHIVKKDGEPANLASYPDRESAERDRDAKHPDAKVHQVGRRGKVKAVSEDQFFQRVLELAGCGRKMEEAEANTTDPLADKAAALAPVAARGSAAAVNVDEGAMSEVDIELHNIARSEDEDELYDALEGGRGQAVSLVLDQMIANLADELAAQGQDEIIDDEDRMIELLMDRLVAEYGEGDLDEAKYQGRKVELNKPTRGGSKKFYVYVKDPKSGNTRKISFGDPNMKIKKSNPERRKSFRARHNCSTAKDKTSARYWSCKMW
jgi:hypothetical protein